jgi:hypothetical protein
MRSFRPFVALTALLLGGLNLAAGADKVLVPGDPPLTQELVDTYRRMAEWALGIELGEKERREWQELFMAEFLKKNLDKRKAVITSCQGYAPYLDRVSKLDNADRERERAINGRAWLDGLRKSKDRDDQMLLAAYDAAYKPGGTKNPILVEGDPPLTKVMIDVDAATTEWVLDLRLIDQQRRKFRDLWVEDWKSWDAAKRQREAKNIEEWANLLPTFNNYGRNLRRALDQPRFLAEFSKKDSGGLARWLLTLHEAAIKPGSARNAVLVEGDPQLTQLVVNRYADYLEVLLDLSVSGGFTAPQRQVLQDYLVKDWKKMSAEARRELLGDLKRWGDAAAKGGDELGKWRKALQPKVLTELRLAADNPRSRWLLETYENERQVVQRMRDRMLLDYETKMSIYRKFGEIGNSEGHFEYNPTTKRYDRWVPNR